MVVSDECDYKEASVLGGVSPPLKVLSGKGAEFSWALRVTGVALSEIISGR